MATDTGAILENLLRFYEFDGKVAISVGAGGGQLAGYGRTARRIVAVDRDRAALAALAERTRALGLAEKFVPLESEFLAVAVRADVVLFEFALHEVPDPGAALAHAATLAPEIVVLDHDAGSPWAHATDETEKVAAAWAAVAARGFRRRESHHAIQRFASHDELVRKVGGQGAEALRRAERWRGCAHIEIPMTYAIALL